MQIEIPDHMLDDLVVENLKSSYINVQQDIARLITSQRPLQGYEYQDLMDHKETSHGLEIVLKYFMWRPEAEKFILKNRTNLLDSND
jgi:hypothetical protein